MPQIVSTPQGNISFPDDMSEMEIQAILRKEFPKGSVPPPSEPFDISDLTPIESKPMGRREAMNKAAGNYVDFLTGNLDIPAGIGGSIVGAAQGARFGPYGAIAGAVLLGAGGTGAGSLASDLLTEEELDYAKAIKGAAISAGFDVATLGLGKVVKVAFAPLIKRAFNQGKTPEQVLKELSEKAGAEPAEAGSRESLLETQRFLSERGATLYPSQIGEAGLPEVMENISRIGMTSSPLITANARRINEITTNELNNLFSKNYIEVGTDPDSLGYAAFSIIDAGKKAVNASYGSTIDEIIVRAGNKPVPVKPIVDAFEKFKADNVTAGIEGPLLEDATLEVIDNIVSRLSTETSVTMPISSLLKLDSLINQQISKVSDISSQAYNSNATRELTQASIQIKGTIQSLLEKVSPETAEIYKVAKKEYAEGIQGILPEMNSRFVNNANKGNYTAIGNLISNTGNLSQLKALKNSMQESFKRVSKEQEKLPGFVSQDDANKLIKLAFLEKTFPTLSAGTIKIEDYANLAKRFSKPAEQARMRIILGDDYGTTKRLINLMQEASEKSNSNLGILALRSEEYRSISNGLQATMIPGSALGGPAFWATAGAVLTVPRMMANLVTNPKYVNKLITFQNKDFKTTDAMQAAAATLIGDIWLALPEEEKQAILEQVFEMGQQEEQ